MKKILITNFTISQFSGSEINCTTIAKRLKELGYEVYVGVVETSAPLYDIVKQDFETIHLLENEFDFSKLEFDLVWSHHSFLLDWLIFEKGLKARKIITSSLSPKEPIESAPIYANELCFSLANSPETFEQLTEKENVKKVYLLENYSFSSYFERNIEIKELHKIAVVSNHIPIEEMQAIDILREKGYEVDIYGFAGTQKLITDKILENYDCIMTIGKTVQYGMSLKIPVYIYDIHGGQGYLKMSNIEENRKHNFSGRGYSKKDSNTIAKEIIEDFKNILPELNEIKEYAHSEFCFETKIDDIIKKVEECNEINLENIRKQYNNYARNLLISKRIAEHCERKKEEKLKQQTIEFYQIKEQELSEKQREIDNRGYLIKSKETEIETLKQQNEDYQKQAKEHEELNIKLEQELQYIKNSKSWRYTHWLRMLRGKDNK